MYILAGEKTLTITSYVPVRDRVAGKVNLEIRTAKENTTAAELEEFTDYIAENAPVLEVYDDTGAKETSLQGFKFYPSFMLNRRTGTWEITIENESENSFQLGRTNEKLAALEQTAAEQEQTIQEQAVTIFNQGQAILDQNIIIANQEETIAQQAEELVLLNDTLLEMLMG